MAGKPYQLEIFGLGQVKYFAARSFNLDPPFIGFLNPLKCPV